MLLEGHVENGSIVLDSPADLPNGTKVRVEVMTSLQASKEQIERWRFEPDPGPTLAERVDSANGSGPAPTLLERLKDFVGVLDGLPEDAATNHDHYLYGAPKQ
jgi:hypothetical protein